jgi:DNA-binding transcriptional LysR family regulator
MDIKDLLYCIAVYDARSFSRAAALLRTVQSNVSTRILALERQLGVALFERRHRTVLPTSHGKRFCRRARRIVAALAALEGSMQRRRYLKTR